jgi:uncharacterized damage-inducible protein DinB
MADRKPPRPIADERTTVLELLQFQRESVVRKVDGLDDAAARHRLVDSGTTLLWLVKHLAQAEDLWILRRFAGGTGVVTTDAVSDEDTLADAVEAYRATWARVDEVVAGADLDQLCADTGTESPVSLRWVLMHLLEETARHAGHADILRELIDGQTGR